MRRRERELEVENKRLRESSLAPQPPKAEPTKLDQARAEPKVDDDPEPDRGVDPEAWRDWKIRDNDRWRAQVQAERQELARQRQMDAAWSGAVEEFRGLETAYAEKALDYYKATEFGRQKYADAMKVMHPEFNDRQIAEHIDKKIMAQASIWAQNGLNAAEEFYDLCIEKLGYVPAKAEAAVEHDAPAEAPQKSDKDEEEMEALANRHRGIETPEPAPPPPRPKPNLKQISAARRRSASPLHGPGQGGSVSLTKEAAASMTMAEFAELSPGALAELEAMEE